MAIEDLGITKYNGPLTKKELISGAIKSYEEDLCHSLDMGGLLVRNAVAHKWTVTFGIYVIRETVFWRFVDIAKQAHFLGESNSIAGARILTRAVIETLSTLVYSISKMEDVISGKITFDEFCDLVEKIYLGSRVDAELPETINVLTMVKQMEKKHKGILPIFEDLCETAHPSMIGLTDGYTKIDRKKFVTEFGNYWLEKYAHQHESALLICMQIFEIEYNVEWVNNFELLEKWLVENDAILEKQRKEKIDSRTGDV